MFQIRSDAIDTILIVFSCLCECLLCVYVNEHVYDLYVDILL